MDAIRPIVAVMALFLLVPTSAATPPPSDRMGGLIDCLQNVENCDQWVEQCAEDLSLCLEPRIPMPCINEQVTIQPGSCPP